MNLKPKILVLGAGESGTGAALLAASKGYDVFVSDSGTIKPAFRARLQENNIEFEEGAHHKGILNDVNEIIKSPGIPDQIPLISLAKSKGITVISEIEFAARFTSGKIIAITGTNGKTTTTGLVQHMLKNAGMDSCMAGNIGNSFAYEVMQKDHEYFTLELSSFQLDGMDKFRANIAILLNITPDHLDRYDHDLSKYAASKMRILRNQQKEDAFAADDETHKPSARSLHHQLA